MTTTRVSCFFPENIVYWYSQHKFDITCKTRRIALEEMFVDMGNVQGVSSERECPALRNNQEQIGTLSLLGETSSRCS